MRICVASSGNGGLTDMVSPVFGRCPSITIVDDEDGEIKNVRVIPNQGTYAGSGAGIQAAQIVVNEGCNVLIAGSIGPNSYQVLSMGRVDMRESPPLTIRDAINAYLDGKLPPSMGQGRGMGGGMGRGMGRRGHGRGGPGNW